MSTPPTYPDNDEGDHILLATERLPLTDATLTVRVIKNFPFRTMKSHVLKHIDLTAVTVGELMDMCREVVKTSVSFKLYRQVNLDTMKKYTVAHGHKTQNLIINLDHDDWILSDLDATLASVGCENETELSFFNRADYDAFKNHPETKWD